MSTTAELLQGIINSKAAIKTSIANKGVTVPDGAMLADCPFLIDSIQQGGGVSAGVPEIVDVVFINPIENAESTDIDVVVRIMSNGATANYGIQYRPVGTANWIEATTPVITDNTDAATLHGFDKIATTTLTGLLYRQSWDANLGALRENNNRYEVRAYIAGDTNSYATPRIYTTGWSKYFDNIFEAANNFELNNTKQKRYIAVMPSQNKNKILSELSGDYYKTSDGYLGISEDHIFDESQDIPIYMEDGINIKYYVRWAIIYSNVASPALTINENGKKSYFYCYFGNCTLSNLTFYGGNISSFVESVRFSSLTVITNIAGYAFSNCNFLSSVILPNSIASIGAYAFSSCVSLTSINIPKNSIGNNAFQYCKKLCSVNLANSSGVINTQAFYNCSSLISIIIFGNIKPTNASNTFNGCYSLEYVILATSVTAICYACFANCSALKKIILSNNCSYIDSSAFTACKSLIYINLHDYIYFIGEYCFENCYSLTSVVIPDLVTSVANYQFRYCYNLEYLKLSNSTTTIAQYAFDGCTKLRSIIIPNSVTTIGAYAFQGCFSLKSAIISSSLTTLGGSIFSSCVNLEIVTMPNSITSFSNTFPSCGNLTSVIIPNSVTTIGTQAFYNNSGLVAITIPNSVTSIGIQTFQNCTSLTSITFMSIPTTFPTTSIVTGTKYLHNVIIPNGWNNSINLVADTSNANNNVLTHRCILAIFNNLASGVTGLTLTLGATNLARMTANEIAIATAKGWTVN